MPELCGDNTLQELVAAAQADPARHLERVDRLLTEFPEDPRLHFLRGSALIAEKRHIEAHRALVPAVHLAPDFDIARFQLGFFQLTSGEAGAALETWGRLDRLPDTHYLRYFVDGVRRLIRDDFDGAIAALREGVKLNAENPPLSGDMELLIREIRPLAAKARGENQEDIGSETSLILSQLSGRPRMH